MILYSFFRSSASWRVGAALAAKRLDYELAPRNFRKGEQRDPAYLALNPQGLVPALIDDGLVLTQSLAIIEYLDERHPAPRLLPEASGERAIVRAMAQTIACDIHPIGNLRVLDYLRGNFGQDDAAVEAWYRHWVASGFAAIEIMAARHGDGRHCFGSALSLADLCLVPQMANARRFGCDLSPYPLLMAIDAHLAALEIFTTTSPQNQPDAVA